MSVHFKPRDCHVHETAGREQNIQMRSVIGERIRVSAMDEPNGPPRHDLGDTPALKKES